MKRKPYTLSKKAIENLMWDFVAGKLKTTALAKKYGVSKTTIKYYRNPIVHKARIRRNYYKKNKK